MNPTKKIESVDQKKFFLLLSEFEQLEKFWNRDELECDPDAIDEFLLIASRGEAVGVRCLVSIWSHTCRNGYLAVSMSDLGSLSDPWRTALAGWIAEPFWP